MAGIYLHIPFCRKACHYCDFHFSTSAAYRDEMVDAMVTEIGLRKDDLARQSLQSVYFGGGTPSILTPQQLDKLFSALSNNFTIEPGAEITLEANPDDLTEDYLNQLRDTPVNRLSIGVQSFFGEHLEWMNRAHNKKEAISSIEKSRQKGFDLLTIDLIYGFQKLSDQQWESNLKMVSDLGLDHFSAYSLTVEKGTVLGHREAKGIESPAIDEVSVRHFKMLQDFAAAHGFRHYEISNLAKPGKEAVHNSAYWQRKPYLGIGPSAHSFINPMRSWNVSNNALYMKGIQSGERNFESEVLDEESMCREKIMTGLRLDTGLFRKDFSESSWLSMINAALKINPEWLEVSDHHIRLTPAGRLFVDRVAVDLFP